MYTCSLGKKKSVLSSDICNVENYKERTINRIKNILLLTIIVFGAILSEAQEKQRSIFVKYINGNITLDGNSETF